jgi:hypothetical protein
MLFSSKPDDAKLHSVQKKAQSEFVLFVCIRVHSCLMLFSGTSNQPACNIVLEVT